MRNPKWRWLFLLLWAAFMLSGCGGSGEIEASPEMGPAGFIVVSAANPRAISPYIYGQNYWNWASREGDQVHGTAPQMAALSLGAYRLGGIGPDQQYPNDLTQSEIDEFIAYCRAIDAEPLLQVSIIGGDKNEAAHWVDYCNRQKDYHVRYWIIGNEPDLYVEMGFRTRYTVDNYISDFKNYAAAMKAVDSSIKLLGPELAWKYVPSNDWMTPFLNECGDLVDVVTFHAYPFGKSGEFTIGNVLSETVTRGKIQSAQSIVHNICGREKPIALTECNVSWNAPISGRPASPETFYTGLWLADILGYALENELWSVDFWSTCERYAVGFLDSTTKEPRPIYYAFQMMTIHFGSSLIQVAESPDGLAVYASRNPENNRTVLMIVNKTNRILPETIKQIDNGASPGDRQLTLSAYSLTCLSIPDDGSAMDIWTYTKAMADQKLPPYHTTSQ